MYLLKIRFSSFVAILFVPSVLVEPRQRLLELLFQVQISVFSSLVSFLNCRCSAIHFQEEKGRVFRCELPLRRQKAHSFTTTRQHRSRSHPVVKPYLFLFVCIPIYILILIIQYLARSVFSRPDARRVIIQLRNSSPLPKDTFYLSTVDNELLVSICLYISRRCLY